jgi:excisionase family DNA binding protein
MREEILRLPDVKRHASLSDDPALDTHEAAAYLDLRPNTLEVWRSTGRYELPFEKIGRLVRYRKSALDRWRAKRTNTAVA